MKGFKDIDIRLCHSCGTCAGVCPNGSIAIVDGAPRLVGGCTGCGLCYDACPGMSFRYPDFNAWIFGATDVDGEIGSHSRIYAGHASDEAVREGGASGGVVSALLMGMLKRKEIAGAVVVGMNDKRPEVAEVKIAKSEGEILRAAQSKYRVVSVNEILRRLQTLDGEFAFVGLPCHVHGIRKLQGLGWKGVDKIKCCIGIFCGFNMSAEATDFLTRKFKVRREDMESLEYRGGGWPGGFLLKTKGGREYFVEKHIYNYLNLIFVPRRCLVCPDLTNEFADVSVGDAWKKNADSRGWSSVIIRTPKGRALVDLAAREGDIRIKEVDKSLLKEGHSQLLLYKKRGVFLRQRKLRLNPDFGLSEPPTTRKERIFNAAFLNLILFMRSGFAIGLFKFVPIRIPGFLGKLSRAAINFVFRPKRPCAPRKRRGFFRKVISEWKYLNLKTWDLKDVGAHWDGMEDYDDINKETYSYFRRFIDGHRLSSLPKAGYVLDICSRTGNGSLFFWERGLVKKALCADFSRRMQSVCAQRLRDASVSFEQRLVESMPLPFNDGEFDAVLCFETAEHVPSPDIFIKELGRVLKKDGQLILTTPNILWRPIHSLAAVFDLHHSEGPCRFISRARLRGLLREAGFEVVAERTTVLIPAGPKFLTRFGERLEEKLGKGLMDVLGLRQVFVCRRK